MRAPSKKFIIVLAGILLLTLAGLAGAVYYRQDILAKTNVELTAVNDELKKSKEIAARAEEARRLLEQDRTRLASIDMEVTDASYIPTMLKDLERVAKDTKNQVDSIQPDAAPVEPRRIDQKRDVDAATKEAKPGEAKKEPTKPEDPYIAQAIRISLKGSYVSTEAFLNRLVTFPKIVGVDEIGMRPVDDRGDELLVSIKLIAYVMKPDKMPVIRPTAQASAAVTPAAATTGGTH